MANTTTLTNGSAVEVSSDEPGFHGAWYVATLVDQVKPSPTQKNTKIGYLVKYDALVKDDVTSEPLTEIVDSSFVRPSPPLNIRRNSNCNGNGDVTVTVTEEEEEEEFEVCDVIDAYHRDGWWIGVVKSVEIGEGGVRKYVVAFENPPEEFEFEKSKMRLHVDWVDSRWVVPPRKTPEQEVGGKNATNDAGPGFTTPSKGAQVDKETVGTSLSAKRSSRLRKKSESNSTADSSVTYSRNKRIINLVEDESRGKRSKSSGSKGKKKVTVSQTETSVSDDIPQDSPPVEAEIGVTPTCHESEDGKSHRKRKGGSRSKSVKKPNGLQQDGHDVVSDIDEQPLSVWYQGTHPLSALKRSSCFSSLDHNSNSPNKAIVTTAGTATDYQKDWPFIKRSPIWDAIELQLTTPQKPHFSPLRKENEDYREGLAVAHMVTFTNIVQKLSEFQPNEPVDMINNSLQTLCDLETHGFDVGPIRGRLNKLLSLKSKAREHEDSRKEVEKELEKCNLEKGLVEKEMEQLKAKMQALNEKMAQITTAQKVKEEQIVRLQSDLLIVSNQIGKLAATPL
ncbi:hypothetical protein SSX86_023732 [Deinandra increscens subsp. villosa]|uniref:Agenet domain-containing protein n=1 Tax=Deinandra increscens subsp. villosa TaxID=3103831 RepID=A0AAP0GQ39_9ASTR